MPEKSHERCLFMQTCLLCLCYIGLQISNCVVALSLTFDLCVIGSIYHFAECSSCTKQVVLGIQAYRCTDMLHWLAALVHYKTTV